MTFGKLLNTPKIYFWPVEKFWGGIEVKPFFRKLTNSSEIFEISTYFFQIISFSCISEFSKCFVCHKTTRIRALKRADFRKPHENFEGGNIVSRKPYRVLLKTCVFWKMTMFRNFERKIMSKNLNHEFLLVSIEWNFLC